MIQPYGEKNANKKELTDFWNFQETVSFFIEYLTENEKSIQHLGGSGCSSIKGNGRNVHVQTKGVYVWFVIYFTSLSYHEIIDTSTFHNEFNKIVTNYFMVIISR